MSEAEFWQGDLAAVLAWCQQPAVLDRYAHELDAELPGCGDASLLGHLRALQRQLALLTGYGLDGAQHQDAQLTDALLSDLLAVATWQHWHDLPLQAAGNGELPLEGGRPGLLGQDPAEAGVLLLCFDNRIAICRHRQADQRGDMSEHWRHCGH